MSLEQAVPDVMGNGPLKFQNYSLNHTISHHKRPASSGIIPFVVTVKEACL